MKYFLAFGQEHDYFTCMGEEESEALASLDLEWYSEDEKENIFVVEITKEQMDQIDDGDEVIFDEIVENLEVW